MGPPIVSEPGARRVRLPFYYGWVNLVLAALAMTATFPGRTNGLAMINKPLQADLRIGDIFHGSLNFWSVLLGAALCWPVGRLLDRLGTRPVLTAIATALGAVVLWMSRVEGPAELFVALTLSRGLGQGALSVVSMAVVGKWFRRRLGPAMGVYSFLLAVGFVAVTLRVGAVVEADGWRAAWAEVGWGLLLGMAPLSALLVRSTPEGSGLADPDELAAPVADEGTAEGVPLSAALRSPAFWVLTLAASLFNMVFSAFIFFSESVLEAQGFREKSTFTNLMAVLMASGLAANLLAGWLSAPRRLGRLLAVGMALLAAALFAFPQIGRVGGALVFAAVLGGSGGVVTVVFFTAYGALYGRRHLGQVQGVAQVLSVFASALGPLLLAVTRDWSGSHALLFQVTAAGAVLFGAACWVVPLPAPRPAPTAVADS
jgi:MFS family permease